MGLDTDFIRKISIHAPRGGSDQTGGDIHTHTYISIHAPRGGSDRYLPFSTQMAFYFNPRSPWGERPGKAWELRKEV